MRRLLITRSCAAVVLSPSPPSPASAGRRRRAATRAARHSSPRPATVSSRSCPTKSRSRPACTRRRRRPPTRSPRTRRSMNEVVAALKQAGGKELQTQQVSLYPQTERPGDVTGYAAQNSVSAKAKIAGAGALIDAAVGAGANTVDGPTLDVSDQDALYRAGAREGGRRRAREGARRSPRPAASASARSSSVTEQSAAAPAPVFAAAAAEERGDADRARDAGRDGRRHRHLRSADRQLTRSCRRRGRSQRAQTLRAAPLRSAMCTGSGFSQVHHNGVGSVVRLMATPFFNVGPARERS